MENNTLFGILPTNWRLEPLYKLTSSIKRGRQPKYSERSDSIPVINQKMIRNRSIDYQYVKYHDRNKSISEEAFVCKNDILINSTGVGTVGRSVFISDELKQATFADSHLTIVRPDTAMVNPRYLSIILSSDRYTRFFEETLAQGSTGQVELSRKKLQELEVPVPSGKTQQAIAYIFEGIDEKITLNQRINSNLLKLMNVMFQRSYLGDERIKSSNTVKLSSIVRTKSNTFNPKKTSEAFVNHFSMPAFDATKFPVVDGTSNIKSNKNIVEPFSILVSKMNPDVKRVWLPNTSKELLNVASTEFLTFNADVPEMQAFVYAVVNDKRYQKYLEANTTGSTNSRQRVLPKVAYAYEIPYVKEVAQQFGFQIVDVVNAIKLNKEQNQHLVRLRNILLPKLIAGDIDLSNIETVMNNA